MIAIIYFSSKDIQWSDLKTECSFETFTHNIIIGANRLVKQLPAQLQANSSMSSYQFIIPNIFKAYCRNLIHERSSKDT